MKYLVFALIFSLSLSSCGSDEPNACLMAFDFIKEDLKFPLEAEHSILDCSQTKNNNQYTVLTKVRAKNALGVQTEFVYKLELEFLGGISVEKKNWHLNRIRSEVYSGN